MAGRVEKSGNVRQRACRRRRCRSGGCRCSSRSRRHGATRASGSSANRIDCVSAGLAPLEGEAANLEELLGEVLEVALGKGNGRDNGELSGSLAGDLDILSELASLALDLDRVDEELFERSSIELRGWKKSGVSCPFPLPRFRQDTHDLVVGGSREVNDELLRGLGGDGLSSDLLGGLGL